MSVPNTEFQVSTGGESPQVFGLTHGEFVIIWRVDNHDWCGQIYHQSGEKKGSEFSLISSCISRVAIAKLANGGFAIIWNEATTKNFLLQLYNSDLSKRGDAQVYNGYLASMSVTGLADGRFVMSSALRVQYSCYNHGVSFRVYNANGTQNSSDITIITDNPPYYLFNNIALSDGKFLVGIPGDRSIYIEIYDVDNSKNQAKIQIDGHDNLYVFFDQ